MLERIGIGAAVFTHSPRLHAPNELFVGHLDLDADDRAASRRDLVERVGLRRRPRKPVEHESGHRIRTRQPLAHDADDQVVTDQLTTLHHGLHRDPELGRAVHCFAQDVPRRDLGYPMLAGKPFRLRALAGPWGPSITRLRATLAAPSP